MDSTMYASLLSAFVMAWGGTKLTRSATGLEGNLKLRAVATLFSVLGVVGTKLATTGSFDVTDVDTLIKSVLEVGGIVFAAHLFHKGTK
jgi:hypothetical protein